MQSLSYESRTHTYESSAFWGQSFVTELTRISEQAEKKAKLRRESTSISNSDGVDNPRVVGGFDGANGEEGATHANGPVAE